MILWFRRFRRPYYPILKVNQYGLYNSPSGLKVSSDVIGWGEGFEYNLPNVMSSMEAYGEEGQLWSPGVSQLGDLLQDINIPGLASTYSQNIGDLNAEIASQIGGLTSGLSGGKGGRYGGLGTHAASAYG